MKRTRRLIILIATIFISSLVFSLSIQAAGKKDLSAYKGVKMGKVMDAFPKGSTDYKYGIRYYLYKGLHFHGNGEGIKPRNVKIDYISLQQDKNYNILGVKVGMTKKKAIKKLKEKGWKSFIEDGDTIKYNPKNGWEVQLYIKNGKVRIIYYMEYCAICR